MAESRRIITARCWYFSNYGSCRLGERCPHPHIPPTNPPTCRYFQQGRCIFGRDCRNLHSGSPRFSESSGEGEASAYRQNGVSRRENDRRFMPFLGRSARGGGIVKMSPPRNSAPSTSSSSSSTFNTLPSNFTALHQPIQSDNAGGSNCNSQFLNRATSASTSFESELPSGNSYFKKQPNCKKRTSELLPGAHNDWVQAPEFVPCVEECKKENDVKAHKSYAEVVNPNARNASNDQADTPLCPHTESGECVKGAECPFVHGEICSLCEKACLHPFDKAQQKTHSDECLKKHEKDMELSFAVARSKEKMCGICFEVIMEKTAREQRFGILPNCNHCFCLGCIRTWRQAKQFENNITRACPECRVTSDFVCPSVFWVDTKEDKSKLITDYKGALSVKDCKYFKKGDGKCPFGNKCFYQHVLPDGTAVDVGPPSRQRRPNTEGDLDVLQHIILWDFLEERDAHILYLDDLDLDDSFFTDSDFSDSELEYVF